MRPKKERKAYNFHQNPFAYGHAQARFAESGPRSHSGDGPEEPGANLPVREAAEGGPIRVPDSTEGSRILIVEPQGFFARLWGAVRGFAGTARIGERGEDDAERNQRRPA